MTQELIDKFVLSARGTFLEEDRNSNFPNENTLLMKELSPAAKTVLNADELLAISDEL